MSKPNHDRFRPTSDDRALEETEAHGFRMGATEDKDTEGHAFKGAALPDDEDTEGHAKRY